MSRLDIREFFFIIIVCRFCLIVSFGSPFFQDCGSNNFKTGNLDSSLDTLFSNLTSSVDRSDDGSAAITVNPGTQDQLNGLIMCYMDSNQQDCLQCLNTSMKDATTICPNSSTASFTYSNCFLHYSTDNFIATPTFDQDPNIYRSDTKSNSSTILETVSELMHSLKQEAYSSKSLYAHGNRTDPGINNSVIYGLVQCSKDLDQNNCDLCLEYAIGNLTTYMRNSLQSIGTRLSFMSCYIRYELYPLRLLTFKSPAPPPVPMPEPPSPVPVSISGPPPPMSLPPSNAGSSGN